MLTRILKKLIGNRPVDPRSRRFVAVIECILNQNIRDDGAACSPAMNFPLLQCCHQHDIGVLQMPCPEVYALGFDRKRDAGQTLRAALEKESSTKLCLDLAVETTNRIEDYLNRGDELVAIVGGNPKSPGCAVHHGPDELRPESGVFMKLLQQELRRRGRDPVFLPMRDYDAALHQCDLEAFEKLLRKA